MCKVQKFSGGHTPFTRLKGRGGRGDGKERDEGVEEGKGLTSAKKRKGREGKCGERSGGKGIGEEGMRGRKVGWGRNVSRSQGRETPGTYDISITKMSRF